MSFCQFLAYSTEYKDSEEPVNLLQVVDSGLLN